MLDTSVSVFIHALLLSLLAEIMLLISLMSSGIEYPDRVRSTVCPSHKLWSCRDVYVKETKNKEMAQAERNSPFKTEL